MDKILICGLTPCAEGGPIALRCATTSPALLISAPFELSSINILLPLNIAVDNDIDLGITRTGARPLSVLFFSLRASKFLMT
jgi:hypothetical protein